MSYICSKLVACCHGEQHVSLVVLFYHLKLVTMQLHTVLVLLSCRLVCSRHSLSSYPLPELRMSCAVHTL